MHLLVTIFSSLYLYSLYEVLWVWLKVKQPYCECALYFTADWRSSTKKNRNAFVHMFSSAEITDTQL